MTVTVLILKVSIFIQMLHFKVVLQVLFASVSDCVSFVFSDLFEPQMEEGQNQNLAKRLTQGEITCIFRK